MYTGIGICVYIYIYIYICTSWVHVYAMTPAVGESGDIHQSLCVCMYIYIYTYVYMCVCYIYIYTHVIHAARCQVRTSPSWSATSRRSSSAWPHRSRTSRNTRSIDYINYI